MATIGVHPSWAVVGSIQHDVWRHFCKGEWLKGVAQHCLRASARPHSVLPTAKEWADRALRCVRWQWAHPIPVAIHAALCAVTAPSTQASKFLAVVATIIIAVQRQAILTCGVHVSARHIARSFVQLQPSVRSADLVGLVELFVKDAHNALRPWFASLAPAAKKKKAPRQMLTATICHGRLTSMREHKEGKAVSTGIERLHQRPRPPSPPATVGMAVPQTLNINEGEEESKSGIISPHHPSSIGLRSLVSFQEKLATQAPSLPLKNWPTQFSASLTTLHRSV